MPPTNSPKPQKVQTTITKDKEKQQILIAEKLKLENLGHFEIKDDQNSCQLLVDFLISCDNRLNLFKENREIFKSFYLPQIQKKNNVYSYFFH